jgi:hypothetical protein
VNLGLTVLKLSIATTVAAVLITTTGGFALAGQIRGKQYVSTNSGALPISDNEISYLPCAPLFKDCKKVQTAFKSGLTGVITNLVPPSLTCNQSAEIMKYIEAKQICSNAYKAYENTSNFIKKAYDSRPMTKITRTNFEGNFSFNCPTQNCLVYSSGKIDNTLFTWVELVSIGQQNDLSKSKAVSFPISIY